MRRLFVLFLLCAMAVPAYAQTQLSPTRQRRTMRQETRQEIGAVISAFHKEAQRRQDEFRAMMDAQRGVLRDAITTKREGLRQRLTVIRDEQKKKKVESIDARMDVLNEQWTSHFSLVLERLENVLETIAERARAAAEKGQDVGAVNAAMTNAKASLAISRTALVLQAGKTYTIAISTEDVLRADVGKTRKALHDDLVAVRETVKNARDTAHNAAGVLAQTQQNKEKGQTATSSPAIHITQ